MNSPVSKLRQRLFLLLALAVSCAGLTACHDDDRHHRHTERGYDHRRRLSPGDGYRRDAYYGGSVGDTSVTVRRDAPVVRERVVTY